MGLIILQLHGRAPYGKQERLAFVWCGEAAGILAQAADFHRELFRVGPEWCTDEKWRLLQGSLFLRGSFVPYAL